MGLQDFVGSVKEKAQKFSKSRPETSPTPPPPVPNLGEEMRLMVESEPFESGFTASAPFLCASLGAWPGYWLFRALDYHSYRAHIPLPIYIKQTYYQAKVVQLFIIMAGTFTVLRKNRRLRWMPTMEVGKT
nr:uncharacterized protein LOC108133235 [Drosophila bipectinata]